MMHSAGTCSVSQMPLADEKNACQTAPGSHGTFSLPRFPLTFVPRFPATVWLAPRASDGPTVIQKGLRRAPGKLQDRWTSFGAMPGAGPATSRYHAEAS